MVVFLIEVLCQVLVDMLEIESWFVSFSYYVLFVVEEQVEIKGFLFSLLYLIIENIGEFSFDDSWFKGQVDGLLVVVVLLLILCYFDEMECCLCDVMVKQSEVKYCLIEVQEEICQMLLVFIEWLVMMNELSMVFQGWIEESVWVIEKVKSIEDLLLLFNEVIVVICLMVEEILYLCE